MLQRLKQWAWDKAVGVLLTDSNLEALSPTNFTRMVFEIRPADVLLVEGRFRVSNVIKVITQSSWSHTALYVGRLYDIQDPAAKARIMKHYDGPPDEPLVIESQLGQGTIVTPLKYYEEFHTRICRPKGISPDDVNKVITHASSFLGMEYDVRQLLDLARFLIPWWTFMPRRWHSSLFEHNAQDATKVVCSSMIASAFASVRFPVLPLIFQDEDKKFTLRERNLRLFTPRDFDYSPYFEIIKYPLLGKDDLGFYRKLPWDESGLITEEAQKYLDAHDVLHVSEESIN
ncbi:MAG: YiiX/YebB-like N1pC/P60 family cysteine hydrolase [Gammaproteobacteria bacterium]|nr:YiiX/YebB-like N1pC/P60 family cysteine hydrolase [Gammaproteobacteria bacterium]